MMIFLAAVIAAGPSASIRVDGDGYLRLVRQGKQFFATHAALELANGEVQAAGGYGFLPALRTKAVGAIKVDVGGTISVGGSEVGQLVLVTFGNGVALRSAEGMIVASGAGKVGTPGEGLFGVIRMDKLPAPSAPVLLRTTTPKEDRSTAKPATINVLVQSEIEGSTIRIQDIATIDGDAEFAAKIGEVSLGASPILNSPRGISAGQILAKLRAAGIDTTAIEVSCPTGASVMRRGQTVTPASILEAATDAIHRQLNKDVAVKLAHSHGTIRVPVGKVSMEATAQADGEGYLVDLSILVDDRRIDRRTLSFVKAEEAIVIKAGDSVKLRVVRGNATVEVDAKAKTAGSTGGTVTVATDTGATFNATVKSAGLVEVKM